MKKVNLTSVFSGSIIFLVAFFILNIILSLMPIGFLNFKSLPIININLKFALIESIILIISFILAGVIISNISKSNLIESLLSWSLTTIFLIILSLSLFSNLLNSVSNFANSAVGPVGETAISGVVDGYRDYFNSTLDETKIEIQESISEIGRNPFNAFEIFNNLNESILNKFNDIKIMTDAEYIQNEYNSSLSNINLKIYEVDKISVVIIVLTYFLGIYILYIPTRIKKEPI